MPLRLSSTLLSPVLCLCLAGCGYAWQKPENDFSAGGPYMAERADMPEKPLALGTNARIENAKQCKSAAGPHAVAATYAGVTALDELPLSRGDLVRISVPGDDAPTGTYKVDSDLTLSLDGVGKLPVGGRTVQQIEQDLTARLVSLGLFRPGHARATVRLLDRAPVRVNVAGAVFDPGPVVINERAPQQQPDTQRETAAGDDAINRSLTAALSHAGGVRPDADIAHVQLVHAGQAATLDLSGVIDGSPVDDVLLVDGDKVSVPTLDCFQAALARPTPITPPGVRVHISNLTTPANNNAGAAVGHDATNLPYGTRFLQALVDGNCVGGTQVTNADRWAVLISVDPRSGQSEVIERRIEALVRRSDRDSFNPVLLPNDGIACYDSAVTNVRDVIHTISDAALSISLGNAIGGL